MATAPLRSLRAFLLAVVATGALAVTGFADEPKPAPMELMPPEVLPAVAEAPPEPEPPGTTTILVDPILDAPRWSLTADIGGGWGGLSGSLAHPDRARALRPNLFPVPRAKLDAFLNPRVTFGYELFMLPGELNIGWQSFTAEGEAILLGYDPLAALFMGYMGKARNNDDRGLIPALVMRNSPTTNAILTSRVDANLADLTYSHEVWRDTRGNGNGPSLRVKLGGRLGGFFSDDRAISVGYEQWVSNWFFGAGPIVGLRGEIPGLGNKAEERLGRLYLGVDGGVLFGETTQRFRETDIDSPIAAYREAVATGDRSVPFLNVEVGSTSHFGPGDRFGTTFGLRYAHFWDIGTLGRSTLDLHVFSVFVGCQYKF